VLSGATLGAWSRRPIDDPACSRIRTAVLSLKLPLRAKVALPTQETRYREAPASLAAAEADADALTIRNARALAERARRMLLREPYMPEGDSLTIDIWLWKLGTIVIATVPGEPFSTLQVALRKRFPDLCIIAAMNSNGTCSYLMPAADYGKGYYQEWMSPTGQGGLELIEAAMIDQLAAWNEEG
jgi:hypothetical protein